MDELRQFAADQRADILLLQEPYTVAGKVAGLPMVSKLIVAQQGNPWAAIQSLTVSNQVGTILYTTHRSY